MSEQRYYGVGDPVVKKVQEQYNLSWEAANNLVSAYKMIDLIGGLLHNNHLQPRDIKIMIKDEYYPIPIISARIIESMCANPSITKNGIWQYFSQDAFKEHFENFVKKCAKFKISNTDQIFRKGDIVVRPQKSIQVVETAYQD